MAGLVVVLVVVIAVPTPLSRAMGDDVDAYESTLSRLEALPTELLIPGLV